MAHSTNSKDAVAASMKRRLNPDDYMSDPKKTEIVMDLDGSPRSYFHADNSLAQLRSRNPLPERYKEGSGGKASGGMVNIDGQQYYQPGILNKEDIARRFEGRGVNSKENNYGLRGEEDKFTGRADSSIASMRPDKLRELVGGVAMRVEDAENKRYANMFLKIHDTVGKAPNLKEALPESNKLVPLGPDGVSMAADKGLTRSDIDAMGAAQRGALADRYAREREAAERARLAGVQRSSDLRDAQYVHGPYVDTMTNRYVIGPEHPLFELEKQQQYRRGFVTKYNAERGVYYTQFDRDLAYSLGVLNDE